MLIGIIATLSFLILIATGAHIFIIFFAVGFVATSIIMGGIGPAISMIGQTVYHGIATPTYSALPLFILMGSFAAKAGFAKDAYDVIQLWIGEKIPGSLGVTTCWGNAAFGAVSGSSLAAAAVFGRIALPEMQDRKYDKSFSLGCIAAAGTFSVMIPPSGTLIILSILTEQSVGSLFMAGIIPGLFTAAAYSISIIIRCILNPKLAPMTDNMQKYTFVEKLKYSIKIWPLLLMIIVVLGGIYSGVFTPTESASAGVFLSLFFGIWKGGLRKISEIRDSLKESAITSTMIFIIMAGAMYYGRVLAVTRLPANLATFIADLKISQTAVVLCVLLLYFFLGMFMNASAFFMFTYPIFYPMILTMGINPIWFCIVSMKMAEIGAVTPPVGLNAYSLKGVAGKNVSLEDVFNGVAPFILVDLIVLFFLFLFPKMATWLPSIYMANR